MEQTEPANTIGTADTTGTADADDVPPRSFRVRGLVVLLPCLAVLGVSFWLSPEPGGVGTHEQLGLSTCGTLVDYGWPCPGCGLTTAFSAMAHGQVAAAFGAQSAGPVLFVVVVLLAVAAMLELVTGHDHLRRFRPGWWCVWAPVLITLIGWGVKAYLGWQAGVYPLH